MSNAITLTTVIDLLNEALVLDQGAITALFECRVQCGPELADHPTIQVGLLGDDNERRHQVGLLGILNGLLGVREDQWGYLSAVYEDGKIVRFEETPHPAKRRQA